MSGNETHFTLVDYILQQVFVDCFGSITVLLVSFFFTKMLAVRPFYAQVYNNGSML